MKKSFFIVSIVLLVFILAACGAQPTPDLLPEGAERDAIAANADIFIANILAGIETQDLATFTTDFDATMIKAFTPDAFEQIKIQFADLGKSQSVELFNVQNVGDYFAVRYKVTYAKKDLVFRVMVDKNDPPKVSGLWFE